MRKPRKKPGTLVKMLPANMARRRWIESDGDLWIVQRYTHRGDDPEIVVKSLTTGREIFAFDQNWEDPNEEV